MTESQNKETQAGKRRHERMTVEITGTLGVNGNKYNINMLDLSKSGAKLEIANSDIKVLPGQSVELTLQWPLETNRQELQVSAKVIRTENKEISVKFDHIPDSDSSD